MIVSFDWSNAFWRVSSQWNVLLGLSNSRKGSIVSVMLNAYDTWFTNPNQERMSVRLRGVGKSAMALMYFLQGRTVSLVISKPANSTWSWAKQNFSGLRVIPCLPQVSSQVAAWKKLSSMVLDHSRVSSTHLVLFGMEEVISSYRLV